MDLPSTSSGDCSGDYSLDAIKTKYHPNSNWLTCIDKFEDYCEYDGNLRNAAAKAASDPWCPFHLQVNFEFSEVALNSCLNKGQIEALLKIIHKVKSGEDNFTIVNHKSFIETWEKAASHLTLVPCITFFFPAYSPLNLCPDS